MVAASKGLTPCETCRKKTNISAYMMPEKIPKTSDSENINPPEGVVATNFSIGKPQNE
jgi:hypothetical protein